MQEYGADQLRAVAPTNFGGIMKLPDVAKQMHEIAEPIQDNHPDESGELFELAAEIKRRSGTRAAASSTNMTPELYEEIKEYADANPGMSHQEIAVVFNVNHGRVSEAISGKRE
jgi:hypothetical protein